jgi:hypothetical protein
MSWSVGSFPPGGGWGWWRIGHLSSVRDMLLWWMHVIMMLLVEGETRVTSAGDIPNHQDVDTIEDRWKAYRNIVRGGFFFNDSVIVLADDEKDIEEHDITNNDNEDSQTTANNEIQTEALSDLLNDEVNKG